MEALLILIGIPVAALLFTAFVAQFNQADAKTKMAPPNVKAHLRLNKRARLEAHYAKISKPRWD